MHVCKGSIRKSHQATTEEAQAEAEAATEAAKTPKQQQAQSAIFAMSFEQQELSCQTTVEQGPAEPESPKTLSPTSARTSTPRDRKDTCSLVEEEKEEKGQQFLEGDEVVFPETYVRAYVQTCVRNAVVRLEKDEAEDTDKKP